jgi:hypothetical protein
MRNDVLGTDFYQILDVDYGASAQEITRQFLIKSHKNNSLPDKIQLYTAYQVLICPKKRADYDRALLLGKLNDAKVQSNPCNRKTILTQQKRHLYPATSHNNELNYALIEQSNRQHDNMREYHRLPLQGHLIINENHQAQLINISPKGLQLELPETIEEYKQVHIRSNIVNGIAKICFIHRNAPDQLTAGLKFIHAKFMPRLFISVTI